MAWTYQAFERDFHSSPFSPRPGDLFILFPFGMVDQLITGRYLDGYHREHQTVVWFWEAVASFDDQMRVGNRPSLKPWSEAFAWQRSDEFQLAIHAHKKMLIFGVEV
jgi:hypothetical protein